MATGVICWNDALNKDKNITALDKIHRQILLMITGARTTTPTLALNELLSLNPLDQELKKRAILCCNRLRAQGNWNKEKRYQGHLKIENLLTKLGASDLAPNSNIRDKKFNIVINEGWENDPEELTHLNDNVQLWFADGAVNSKDSGIGIFRELGGATYDKISIPISRESTSSQAETKAIEMWATRCLMEGAKNAELYLHTDSLSTLEELKKYYTNKETIRDCHNKLNKLSEDNKVTLVWTYRDAWEGNMRADKLAKDSEHSNETRILVPLTVDKFKKKLDDKINSIKSIKWNAWVI